MDEAFNPCELVEFDIGPIILDPFDCTTRSPTSGKMT